MRHESSFRWLACFAGSLPAYEYSPWQTSRPLPLFRLTAGVKISSIAPSIPDKLFMLQGYDSPIRRTSGNQRQDDVSHLDVTSFLLHSRPMNRIEQQLESSFCLGAMLDAETEHHNLSLPFCESDGRSLPLQAFCSVGIPGDQNVFGIFRIPGDDGALNLGSRGGSLKSDRRIEKSSHFVGHAPGERMIGIKVHAQQRSRNIE